MTTESVSGAVAPPETRPRQGFWPASRTWIERESASLGRGLRLTFGNHSIDRLNRTLAVYEQELDEKTLQDQRVLALLSKACQAVLARDAELGWRCFMTADRLALAHLSDQARLERAEAILIEARRKLGGSWRLEAVAGLLDAPVKAWRMDSTQANLSPEALARAHFILSEHFDNLHLKTASLRWQVGLLSVLALLGIGVLWAQSAFLTQLLQPTSQQITPVWLALLMGGLGAACSGILALTRRGVEQRIPEQVTQAWATFTRLVVGMLAALLLYAILVAGLLKTDGQNGAGLILALSFVAGFSERLLNRAVESAGG